MKVVVFDLGGTLMQYRGMPYSWVAFYRDGFEAVLRKFHFDLSEEAVEKALEILKEFNPRVRYREKEYSPASIFSKATEHWGIDIPIQDCIETFWSGLKLKAEIYADTVDVLRELKRKGYRIAALTDLPSAMPDELFKKDIKGLLNYFDYYVSSAVAGYRKPNDQGLKMISEHSAVPITELIFVGDEEKDRKTAENANCRFVKIQREEKDLDSIHNLYELLELLS